MRSNNLTKSLHRLTYEARIFVQLELLFYNSQHCLNEKHRVRVEVITRVRVVVDYCIWSCSAKMTFQREQVTAGLFHCK